jgi:hypothetical protein
MVAFDLTQHPFTSSVIRGSVDLQSQDELERSLAC